MTQKTKRFVQKKAGQQIKKRVSRSLDKKLKNTRASRLTAAVTAKTAVVVDKADAKVQSVKKLKTRFSRLLALSALVAAAFHRLNKLYSFIPRLQHANEKVRTLTGIDVGAMLTPSGTK